ncbi:MULTISPECIES: hypothetical protein [unclassified Paenibacillus]|uniref:hypothetical protein n=1 Tax=unclassified Paenibacillus TaxID=185978 RepID=UPI00034E75B1|nr:MULTISPECIES: hypothetical protein [unclassified Paenibacillus]EPD82003.1 hypothetical protein HMPREF1207_03829 [Paenibacillus sp. HGH0039]
MTINKKAFTINLISLVLGITLLFIRNESDPNYLRMSMLVIGVFATIVGAYGIFKSLTSVK